MACCKYFEPHKLLKLVNFISLIFLYVIPTIYGMAFLHSTIGVVFSPYVHHEINHENVTNDWLTYQLSEVKAMAKLISTRFPILVTYGIGTRYFGEGDQDRYTWDSNYYNCYSQVYVCEAVANINNATYYELAENKTKNKGEYEDEEFEPLHVYQGIFVPIYRLRVDLELNIAIEAIHKANRLFPGTVTGIVFYSQVDTQKDYANATLVLDVMKKVELQALQNQLKIGTKQNCNGIFNGKGDIGEKRRQIIQFSDFIICEVIPSTDQNVTDAVVWVIGKILKFRKELKTLNPWLDVMFETGWPADEGNRSQTIQLQTFWSYLESWSLRYDVNLWMNEAFDTIWSNWDRGRYWGWWKLESDNGTGDEYAYIEKIPHEGRKYTKKSKGEALATGKQRVQKIEQLIPPVLAFGRIGKVKQMESITPVYEESEEIFLPAEE